MQLQSIVSEINMDVFSERGNVAVRKVGEKVQSKAVSLINQMNLL